MIVTFHCKPKIKMLDHDCPHVHSQSSFHWLWKHISKWWSLLMGCYLVRLSSKAYVSFSHPISVILVVYAKRKKKIRARKPLVDCIQRCYSSGHFFCCCSCYFFCESLFTIERCLSVLSFQTHDTFSFPRLRSYVIRTTFVFFLSNQCSRLKT